MRETVFKCVVLMGVGLAAMTVQGCKKQAAPAPAQSSVPTAAQVTPDFHVGPLPVEDVDTGAPPRQVDRPVRQRPQVQPVQTQNTDARASAAAAQARQDARLLQQQQAASQRQQQELDQDIEEDVKTQQEVQAEPRIQDVPEVPLTTPPEPPQ